MGESVQAARPTVELSQEEIKEANKKILDLMYRYAELGVEWGKITAKPDDQHVHDFAHSLQATREHFGLGDAPRELHGVYVKGSEVVIAHTGISPNSSYTARLITGLLNSAPGLQEHRDKLMMAAGSLAELIITQFTISDALLRALETYGQNQALAELKQRQASMREVWGGAIEDLKGLLPEQMHTRLEMPAGEG